MGVLGSFKDPTGRGKGLKEKELGRTERNMRVKRVQEGKKWNEETNRDFLKTTARMSGERKSDARNVVEGKREGGGGP